MWRARFERGFGPVVRQTTKWMNEWWMYICRYERVCVCVYVRPLCIALVLMEERFWKWEFSIILPMPKAYSLPWSYWECAEPWIALRITFCWKDKMISHSCLRTTEILRAEQNPYNMNNKMLFFLLIYFNSKPPHVSSRLAAHHQENQLCINSNCCSQHKASVLWVAYATHSTLKPVPTLPR
jgi:hypothetical protein